MFTITMLTLDQILTLDTLMMPTAFTEAKYNGWSRTRRANAPLILGNTTQEDAQVFFPRLLIVSSISLYLFKLVRILNAVLRSHAVTVC